MLCLWWSTMGRVCSGYCLTAVISVWEGCRRIVCESQYNHSDLALARANDHMTARQVGKIAQMAGAEELILFHLSVRYTSEEWLAMLEEARAEFPNTRFPEHWEFATTHTE